MKTPNTSAKKSVTGKPLLKKKSLLKKTILQKPLAKKTFKPFVPTPIKPVAKAPVFTSPVFKVPVIKAPEVIKAPAAAFVVAPAVFTNPPAFVIETAKWSWAEKVQSKNVYRDEQFVRTKTKEEALEAIDFLMQRPVGLTYVITVFHDGEYFTHFRHSMPCLGGLVKYRDSHGEKHFMNPYFPRDIYVAFPEGEITFIACYRKNSKDILKNPYNEFILSAESPWVSAFGNKDTIIFKDDYFVLTNMDADPTAFYSLMRLGGLTGSIYDGGKAVAKDYNPKAEILLGKSSYGDPRRLAGQKPIKTSGGTWAEGHGYCRPFNESIFKTKIPCKFKDFGGLAGYPQAPYDNKYFIETMKNKFGCDISKRDQKLNDALAEAWEFFKEESKSLSDAAGE